MTDYLTKRGKVACLIFAVAALAIVIPMMMNWTYAITDSGSFTSCELSDEAYKEIHEYIRKYELSSRRKMD